MKTRTLGSSGLDVSAIGFGCMGLSFGYGQPTCREEGLAIIRAAVDAGVNSSIPPKCERRLKCVARGTSST
jgi:aryl-alcohol dehydrogenase-like predicted oxidoreductase